MSGFSLGLDSGLDALGNTLGIINVGDVFAQLQFLGKECRVFRAVRPIQISLPYNVSQQ